jgi:hypothetical protein
VEHGRPPVRCETHLGMGRRLRHSLCRFESYRPHQIERYRLSVYSYENTYHVIYHETCDEFERVRSICLEENNWLRENYTKENLVIEDHNGYVVIYQRHTDKPILMAGVYNNGKFPENVARLANRLYLFPEFRCSRSNMLESYVLYHQRIVRPLIDINNFDVYIMTMQNRKRGNKGWWKLWKSMMQESSDYMWNEVDGYIQSCPHMVQKCWQNFVYTETKAGSFLDWNPKIIDHNEWLLLPEGR